MQMFDDHFTVCEQQQQQQSVDVRQEEGKVEVSAVEKESVSGSQGVVKFENKDNVSNNDMDDDISINDSSAVIVLDEDDYDEGDDKDITITASPVRNNRVSTSLLPSNRGHKTADEHFFLRYREYDDHRNNDNEGDDDEERLKQQRYENRIHANIGYYDWNWHNETELTSFFAKRIVQKKLTDMGGVTRSKSVTKEENASCESIKRHYYSFDKVMSDARAMSGHTMESYETIQSSASQARRTNMVHNKFQSSSPPNENDREEVLNFGTQPSITFKTAKQVLSDSNRSSSTEPNDKDNGTRNSNDGSSVLDHQLIYRTPTVTKSEDSTLNSNDCSTVSWKADCSVRLTNNEDKIKFPIHLELEYPSSTNNNRNLSWTAETPSSSFSVSFLKSLIQKCVRMCRPEAAVRAAKELMLFDFTEFIRRIPVIMCEDSLLHPGYPIIVWLMMACSKCYKPSLNDANYCLQFIYEIAACEWRDFEWKERRELKEQEVSKVINQQTLSSLHPLESSLIKSLLSRMAFGGMTVDIVMLRNHANIWARRFLDRKKFVMPEQLATYYDRFEHQIPKLCGIDMDTLFPPSSVHLLSPWTRFLLHAHGRHSRPVQSFECIGRLQKDDLLLKAVDMHCFPIVDKLFSTDRFIHDKCQEFMRHHFDIDLDDAQRTDMNRVQAYEQSMSDKMSSLIWTFRSGPNAKQCVSGREIVSEQSKDNEQRMEHLWQQLRAPLDKVSMRFMISKYHSDDDKR